MANLEYDAWRETRPDIDPPYDIDDLRPSEEDLRRDQENLDAEGKSKTFEIATCPDCGVEEWLDAECDGCGVSVHNDCRTECQRCGDDYCKNCQMTGLCSGCFDDLRHGEYRRGLTREV